MRKIYRIKKHRLARQNQRDRQEWICRLGKVRSLGKTTMALGRPQSVPSSILLPFFQFHREMEYPYIAFHFATFTKINVANLLVNDKLMSGRGHDLLNSVKISKMPFVALQYFWYSIKGVEKISLGNNNNNESFSAQGGSMPIPTNRCLFHPSTTVQSQTRRISLKAIHPSSLRSTPCTLASWYTA